MPRWEEGTRERLAAAAMALFVEQGFEQTTAAEIAAAAGVTERTFYRHFADKREVLFGGGQDLLEAFKRGIDDAPPHAAPLNLIAAGLAAAANFFTDQRRPWARKRQKLIDDTPSLRERELHKGMMLRQAVHDALTRRGVEEPAASLAADTGSSIFTLAFQQWLKTGEKRSMATIQQELLTNMQRLLAN